MRISNLLYNFFFCTFEKTGPSDLNERLDFQKKSMELNIRVCHSTGKPPKSNCQYVHFLLNVTIVTFVLTKVTKIANFIALTNANSINVE